MFRRSGPLFVALCVGVVLGNPGWAQQEKKEGEVVVISPKAGEKVDQITEIEGEMKTNEGWPVVFVRALVSGDQPWWIQSKVETITKGKFTTSAQFGNDETKPGTKFRIVVVLARSKEEAHKFEKGMTRNSLPAGLPRSEYVSVMRGE